MTEAERRRLLREHPGSYDLVDRLADEERAYSDLRRECQAAERRAFKAGWDAGKERGRKGIIGTADTDWRKYRAGSKP